MNALLPIAAAVLASAAAAAAGPPAHAEPAALAPRTVPVTPGAIGRMIAAAAPGATVVVPPGEYHEHLQIDRPLRLVAGGRVTIDGDGSGDIIEITAPDVTVQGFIIRNTGTDLDKENAAIRATAPRVSLIGNRLEDILFGIDLRESPDSRVENNTIGGKDLDIARRGDGLRLWRADRAMVTGNTMHNGRDAILWYSTGVTIRGNRSLDCRYGLHLMFSDSVVIEDNDLIGNSVGVYLMYSSGVELRRNRLLRNRGPSGYGIGLKETDKFSVRDNLIVGNRAGIYIDGSPFTASQPGEFTGNTLACNDVGMMLLPSARGNEVFANNFIDNIDQVAVAGRGTLEANRFWRGERGNYWSDYTGYDQNCDGVGDFVHESFTLFENLMDRQPSLRLFLFSPSQLAIEFVGRVLPAVRPEPKFTDEVPLMRPVPIALAGVEPVTTAQSWRLFAGGAGLLSLGGLVLTAARRDRGAIA